MTKILRRAKREPGNMSNYRKIGEKYKCRDCGSTILAAKVACPVHIGNTPLPTGESVTRDVPYCPKCERKPKGMDEPVHTAF